MKKITKIGVALAALLATSFGASAQYAQIANQLPQLLTPALSGSLNYKGFVDASYLKGIGPRQADFVSITTSQGFSYSSWFYMGVGIGADIMMAHTSDNWGNWNPGGSFDREHSSTKTGFMLPLFTDFRFTLGQPTGCSFFIDLKLGGTFLLSSDYIQIGNGYLTNSECFFVRPSLGLRIPTNSKNPKQAFDIGVTYNLITNNYWCNYDSNVTLSSLGVTVAFEW